MDKKSVTIAHLESVSSYPPVISLLDNLLNNGHKVFLVSCDIEKLPERIRNHNRLQYVDIPLSQGGEIVQRIRRRRNRTRIGVQSVQKFMENSDILWTTTDLTVRCLGDVVLQYRHVMQLMELERWYPLFHGAKHLTFPLEKYAQRAWKVVVPEINRAYIQRTWWKLNQTPVVLPNKPYYLTEKQDEFGMDEIIDKLQKERRKIVLYLGAIAPDRNLEPYAKAVQSLGRDYCLYIVGRPFVDGNRVLQEITTKYSQAEYAGYFTPPRHLLFLKYAHIGILSYCPTDSFTFLSELNALYCAPNKIFEYAGFGIPMLGSDVPGLRYPFEKYHIGVCCKNMKPETITDGIRQIEQEYEMMHENCLKYNESVDLDQIVCDILYEEGD